LIDAGANLNSKTKSGETALHWALQLGHTEIVELLLDAGAKANDYEQVSLGIMYLEGNGVLQDYKEAEKWFREAAKKGISTAQVNLGIMYLNGTGVPRDYKEAEKWLRKAAKKEISTAQYILGAIYFEGLGVTKDYKEAEKWFHKAAKQGVSTAQANLGILYLEGNGVPQDYKEAEKWFRKAAKKGNSTAQANLGILCLQGNGVSQDYKKAEKWLRKAAEHGDTAAQYMLGNIYVEGLGVTKDYIQAYMWLTFSIDGSTDKQNQFLEKATDLRDSIVKKMTPRQITEAEQLAKTKEWELTYFKRMNNGAYSAGRDVTEPITLRGPVPPYTEQARNSRITGTIGMQCFIRKDGTANNCKITRELGYGLDESAIDTIENKWRFKPATYKGKPVDFQVDIEITFSIY
ncbi:MAG: TonB family protein, partial [Acidobacteria bacterium]|nr:TonB family protein [Acidobacteriota bacterium]